MTTIQDIADKLGISKSAVSKALNNAPDISETLQKQVLETAVELGYTKLRRYKKPVRKLCIIVQRDNIEYEEPHQFAYDIVMGFRQAAEPSGCEVSVVPVAGRRRPPARDLLRCIYAAARFLRGVSARILSGRTVDEGPEDQPHPGSAL